MFKKIIVVFLMFPFILSGMPQAHSEISGSPRYILTKLTLAPERHEQQSKSHQVNSTQRGHKKKEATLSELYRRFPETIITKGPKSKKIALTFDDVPDPRFTPAVLDILSKYHVRATFFVVGNRAEKHPGLLSRIHREGHAIGNHSYDHPLFTKIPLSQFQNQILTTERRIQYIVGYKPTLIRPPYGDITEEQLKWAKKHGYKIVNWNVDSLDWKGISKEQVKKNILSSVGRGSIILQHAGGGVGSDLTGTIEALPEVIQNLRKKGYTFVTVPELLHIPEGK